LTQTLPNPPTPCSSCMHLVDCCAACKQSTAAFTSEHAAQTGCTVTAAALSTAALAEAIMDSDHQLHLNALLHCHALRQFLARNAARNRTGQLRVTQAAACVTMQDATGCSVTKSAQCAQKATHRAPPGVWWCAEAAAACCCWCRRCRCGRGLRLAEAEAAKHGSGELQDRQQGQRVWAGSNSVRGARSEVLDCVKHHHK
jgi:hypothetical protein